MGRDYREDVDLAWWLLSWEGEAQWFAKSKLGVAGGRLKSRDQLLRAVDNATSCGLDFYLNANPTSRCGTKAQRSSVRCWRYVIIDIDPISIASEYAESQSVELAHWIFTGRGHQFWIPLTYSPTIPADAERSMGGYLRHYGSTLDAPGWKVDTSCSDLARVVRCPGSINFKTGQRARVEHITLEQTVPQAILNYASEMPAPVEKLCLAETLHLRDVIPHLKVSNQRFLLQGQESPGRHTACWRTSRNLMELGVSLARAEEWVLGGARKCDPPLLPREARMQIERAYRV